VIRVVVVSPTSEWGGPEATLLELVKNIDASRFAVTTVFPRPGPYSSRLQELGVPVHIAPLAVIERRSPTGILAFGAELLSGIVQTVRIAQSWEADLLVTNCSASIVGALAARMVKRPHVGFAREIWEKPALVTRPLYRCLYRESARIVAVSHAVKQRVFGADDARKVDVVYDSIDPACFESPGDLRGLRTELAIHLDQPVVCTLARLTPQKGIHTFLEAAALVHKKYPDVRFLVVGDIPRPRYEPYKEQLVTIVRERKIQNCVRFLGWRTDVRQLLALSTVNVLASERPEGAGRVIPEGWAAGVPAVVADHTGPAEIVRDGLDGLHFRTGDPVDLARKIEYLLAHPAQRLAMRSSGRERASKLFDVRQNTRRIESIWEEVVAG